MELADEKKLKNENEIFNITRLHVRLKKCQGMTAYRISPPFISKIKCQETFKKDAEKRS
jgi:hypothetical protein